MSAKGRGPNTGGSLDQNFTPAWAVDRLLEAWTPNRPGGVWLEPGAGDGAIIQAAQRRRSQFWHAVEIEKRFVKNLWDAGAGIVTTANFLTGMPDRLSDVSVALGNPPFTWAAEFLVQCWTLCPEAEVVLLLPLNFLASDKRRDMLADRTPSLYVLPDRPSFTADGATDAQDYAWMRWGPNGDQPRGTVTILKSTPLAIRKGRT